YRDKDQLEVDLVIEQDDRLWGAEVKKAASVLSKDGRGLARLAEQAGSVGRAASCFTPAPAPCRWQTYPMLLLFPWTSCGTRTSDKHQRLNQVRRGQRGDGSGREQRYGAMKADLPMRTIQAIAGEQPHRYGDQVAPRRVHAGHI